MGGPLRLLLACISYPRRILPPDLNQEGSFLVSHTPLHWVVVVPSNTMRNEACECQESEAKGIREDEGAWVECAGSNLYRNQTLDASLTCRRRAKSKELRGHTQNGMRTDTEHPSIHLHGQ